MEPRIYFIYMISKGLKKKLFYDNLEKTKSPLFQEKLTDQPHTFPVQDGDQKKSNDAVECLAKHCCCIL